MAKWTAEEDAILTKKWSDGLDARAIARDPLLSKSGRNRMSVISRAHRLNLPPHSSQKMKDRPTSISAHAERFKGQARPNAAQAKTVAPIERLIEVDDRDDGDVRPGAIGAIHRLRAKECKFPIGDVRSPDFDFCKKPQAAGLPYCPDCAKKAYQTPTPRRRTDDRIRHLLVTKEKINA